MTTSAKLREALEAKKILNGRQLAEHMGSKGVIFFVKGRMGWWNSHVDLRYRDKSGQEVKETFRPDRSVSQGQQVRTQLLEAAQTAAREKTGVESWSRAPFSNCWLPSEDVSRVHEEFDPEATPAK